MDNDPSMASADTGHQADTHAGADVGERSGACVVCGYDLSGLPESGTCPECGTPVALSRRDAMLVNSAPTYLAGLVLGLKIVLVSAIVGIGAMLVGMVLSWLDVPGADLLRELLGLAIGLASLYGWWKISEPDLGFTGPAAGDTARLVLRGALVANLAFAVVNLAATFSTKSLVLTMLVGGVALVIGAVQFFATMQYLMWLAPRMPSEQVYRAAKRNRWVLPLLIFPGTFLVIPPIIALVLYLLLLNRTRKAIEPVLAEASAGFAGPVDARA